MEKVEVNAGESVSFVVEPVQDPATAGPVAKQIYTNMRLAITQGSIPQGTRLNEKKLAEDLNISRVPLRESLPLLESHGFVKLHPRRSAVVRTWTRERVNHLLDARLSLEPQAARYAAHNVLNGATTHALQAAIQHSEDIVAQGDHLQIAEASANIHMEMVRLTHNQLLIDLMETITPQMIWLFCFTAGRDSALAVEEHREMLGVIQSGKGELAKASTYRHIELGREPSLAFIRDEGEEEHLAEPIAFPATTGFSESRV